MHSFQSHGHDGPPSLLPHHVCWIDIVDVRARFPFAVSGALYSSDGEEAKVPSTPCLIPVVGSKMLLQFSSTVQQERSQTIHLARVIFIEL
jgi:hypothetical protein